MNNSEACARSALKRRCWDCGRTNAMNHARDGDSSRRRCRYCGSEDELGGFAKPNRSRGAVKSANSGLVVKP